MPSIALFPTSAFRYLLFWSLLALSRTGFGQVRLPGLIADGLVLQRDRPVNVWGWAQTGETVEVSLNGQTRTTTTGPDGKWLVRLDPMKAGGPYEMRIRGRNEITLKDVLVGEVWLCSGQSNMVIPMERVKERFPDAIAQARYPHIRQFFLPTRYRFDGPAEDVPPGRWVAADPQTILSFSAVAYFFALDLHRRYQVPIGLINTAVGGTPAEAWLSADALKAFPEHLATVETLKDTAYVNGIRRRETAAIRAWQARLNRLDQGHQGEMPWSDPAADTAGWSTMNVPGYWEDAGAPKGNGVVWFRRDIDVPAAMTGRSAKLFLGRIVDSDSVFINGRFAGTIGYQYPPRRYELPAGLLKPGRNTLIVRVINTVGKGGFVPEKRYELVAGDRTLDLKGLWQYRVGATTGPMPGTTFFQYKPEGVFNAMVAPMVNYTIRGALWYQGEANTSRPEPYGKLLPALITDWRNHWKQGEFPFLFVQLANYRPVATDSAEGNWPRLREAQRRTLAVPNTAMVVAIDAGEWNDIHPLDKETVGKRLALAARKLAYGEKDLVASGPLYQSMQRNGSALLLTFSNTGSGLTAKGGVPLKQFAIAGADGKFVPATATIRGNQVEVQSAQVPEPVAVRYAWADDPVGANLYNREGLPATPFTTEP
ncbi:sialate O-acetylesterase [Larkinella soli]|uniref:sialate O-acetylesterase n=1 Tax=Larkinella soli TaxID=1770527 RepID=UPI000FFC2C37|nr:sialate O-acetylesterase [Larkinella soli]